MSIRIAPSPLAATFEIQVGPIRSHFGRPMLSHRHPRNLKSPKCSVTSGCRFFTYATCSVAWFASFIVMADARSMTEIRGGTSSVIRTRLTDSREEQRAVQVCHLQRRPPWHQRQYAPPRWRGSATRRPLSSASRLVLGSLKIWGTGATALHPCSLGMSTTRLASVALIRFFPAHPAAGSLAG